MPHTPGPWHFNQSSVFSRLGVYAGEDDDVIICDVTDEDVNDFRKTAGNARLIAAAPDLLKALQNVMQDASEGSSKGRALDLLPKKAIEAARAAISRATQTMK